MQASKAKEIDKQTKKEPKIIFWDKTGKKTTRREYIHKIVSQTAENI